MLVPENRYFALSKIFITSPDSPGSSQLFGPQRAGFLPVIVAAKHGVLFTSCSAFDANWACRLDQEFWVYLTQNTAY
jgi:hypothetical protein